MEDIISQEARKLSNFDGIKTPVSAGRGKASKGKNEEEKRNVKVHHAGWNRVFVEKGDLVSRGRMVSSHLNLQELLKSPDGKLLSDTW